MKLYQNKSI